MLDNPIEYFLVELGLSWTFSKFLPYLSTLLLGALLLLFTARIAVPKWVRFILMFVTFFLPFGIYFFIYPVYQPDITNEAYRPKVVPSKLPKNKTLVVVVLPGCPFCMQTTKMMRTLANQNKELDIVYYLVSEDPIAQKQLKKRLGQKIEVSYNPNATLWMLAAEGVFPSFILIDKNKAARAWHNTTFGVRALDELRSYR